MSDLAIDYQEIMRQQARLIILKALGGQANESMNSSMLEDILPTFAIDQPRPWLHQQLEYLEMMGAVTLVSAGTVKVATLTELGRRHLDRKTAIEGVKRPSRPGA